MGQILKLWLGEINLVLGIESYLPDGEVAYRPENGEP
jgi:hypothetical protein